MENYTEVGKLEITKLLYIISLNVHMLCFKFDKLCGLVN